MKSDIVIIIPAYNPDNKLIEVIKKLKENQFFDIILVDDGSEKKEIFEYVKEDVNFITYNKNRGKGRALKIGMNYFLNNYINKKGVITVDADGQHLIEDINKVYESLKKSSENLVLGYRNFDGKNIPFRSKFGNKIFRNVLKIKTKVDIKDTQTGLRGIPTKYLKEFYNINGERFDYETKVLIYCIKNNIQINQVEIQTIYTNKNKASHFKPIRDSIKILKLIFK